MLQLRVQHHACNYMLETSPQLYLGLCSNIIQGRAEEMFQAGVIGMSERSELIPCNIVTIFMQTVMITFCI